MTPIETPDPDVIVVDDAIDEINRLYDYAIGLCYETHALGLATFHGIAMAPPVVGDLIAAADPRRKPMLSFFRKSPLGQREPHFIHSDRSMGAWTALLYLTREPADGDGTDFWEDIATGHRADASDTLADYAHDGQRWSDESQWRSWYHVAAKYNRLLIFPAPYYHSRALRENYGTGSDARLINVTFGELVCQ